MYKLVDRFSKVAGVLILLLAAPSFAENIPPRMLEAYERLCMSECATNEMISDRCPKFCSCRIRETQNKVSLEALLDINVAQQTGQQIPEKYARLDAEIAKTCLLEAFRSDSE